MRNKRYRQQTPKLGHYIRYDESGELHLFFDEKKKTEWDKNVMNKHMKKIKERIQEMRKK